MRFFSLLLMAVMVMARFGSSTALDGQLMGILSSNTHPRRDVEQEIVTFDKDSLFIHGKRVMIFSAEIHPFRLPVPSLWLDLFQKVKALGFNCVSFYVNWALLEGKRGEFRADGVFALEKFFEAATEAGIWLIARPGPYIQAEVSGGGLPGWMQRVKGRLRTSSTDYLAATDLYMSRIGKIIAEAQITKGGPVILFQPENEYMFAQGINPFPDRNYLDYVINQARQAGIVVPLISNDGNNWSRNISVPGHQDVDILGYDTYPLGFNCKNPSQWSSGKLPWGFRDWHQINNPDAPLASPEFQGGAYDPWGGPGFEKCQALLNHEFERVFYKSNWGKKATIFNIYMTYGGTNWGNQGYPIGYTSYDYGAAIAEDRTIVREKYSELKLQAQFLAASPDYLVASPSTATVGGYTSSDALRTEPVLGNGTSASFFVVRHQDYTSWSSTPYSLTLPTSHGNITIPQLGGSLTLNGRDSKVHVVDYSVGNTTLLYSTAEIFTWKQFDDYKVLVVYGGADETHELAIKSSSTPVVLEGENVQTKSINKTVLAKWQTSSSKRILKLDDLYVYILDRGSAYQFWVTELPNTTGSIIVNGGHLIRQASIERGSLSIKGDFNATTPFEVIGAPKSANRLIVNGRSTPYKVSSTGSWLATVSYRTPGLSLPDLKSVRWSAIDTLPEIQSSYDDSTWTEANHKTSNNTMAPLKTPVSLYGGDYGFHAGVLVFRGHFVADGNEDAINIQVQGGSAFASAAWFNGTFLGSQSGKAGQSSQTMSFALPNTLANKIYVLTVLVDNNGYDLNWKAGLDEMKNPRGILAYNVTNSEGTALNTTFTWRLTGNLGGEDYRDLARGPLNEGGFFAERQGYHLPKPSVNNHRFSSGNPFKGLDRAGATLYTAEIPLAIPANQYDVPLSLSFTPDQSSGAFRALIYVNGWNFGKLAHPLGPQYSFPVPEGILNYSGRNTVAIILWTLEEKGAKLSDLTLEAKQPIWSAREPVQLVDSPVWRKRTGAY